MKASKVGQALKDLFKTRALKIHIFVIIRNAQLDSQLFDAFTRPQNVLDNLMVVFAYSLAQVSTASGERRFSNPFDAIFKIKIFKSNSKRSITAIF